MAKKIVIDARMWGESGVGRYIRNLVFNLQVLDQDNEYFLILLEKDFNSADLLLDSRLRGNDKSNFHKILGNFKWYGVREQIELPRILRKIKPDLVHSPHFNVPIFYRGRFVVTIHDLIHQHFQMRRATTRDPFTYKLKSFGYSTVFKSALRKSARIIVPSNYVKTLLVEEWKVEDQKVVVTPEAVDEGIIEMSQRSQKSQGSQKIFEKFGIKSSYILYVGNAHPHKNVEGLIKAFLQLRKKYKDLQLVLAGNEHYFWERIKMDPRFRGDDIIYTGFVTDEELVALYKNAQVFVQPSFEEGFGIPILEAFACSCPVVSSNAGSLTEVGGNAAVYFDPKDIDDMVDKISTVLNNEKLRKDLIEKGRERVKDFSWKKLAKETLEVYLENSNRS